MDHRCWPYTGVTAAVARLIFQHKFPSIDFVVEVRDDRARHFIDDIPASAIGIFPIVKVHLSLDLFHRSNSSGSVAQSAFAVASGKSSHQIQTSLPGARAKYPYSR